MITSKNNKVPLSIIIPAYNEEERLPLTLDAILEWSNNTSLFNVEFIIVNDGSSDRTSEIVCRYIKKDARIRLIEETHVGFMNAIISGFKQARYPYVSNMDADCAVHPREFENLFRYLDNNTIVMGSRILRGNLPPIKGKSIYRRILSWGLALIFYLFFKCKVYDPQIGFKMYHRDSILHILSKLSMEHDGIKSAEIIVKAYGLGLSIKEIPVIYQHDENSRCVPKGIKSIKVVWGALCALFRLWVHSYQEYQKGNLIRLPIRGVALIELFLLKIKS